MMQERKIDFLLMRQDEEYYGGYVRWFSAVAPRHGYPYTVIFPRDDEMTAIASAPPGQGKPPKWALHGVKQTLGAPYYPSFHYTNTLDAELAVGVLGKKMHCVSLLKPILASMMVILSVPSGPRKVCFWSS